ncbi:hypothetical protein RHGRI_009379 [Rhododendron griersonianum]|uniref:J domain-containing protein n=1 Tax=Rhododendron griersonianum TaxID=479676 RepID=A0AAV6KEM1_9ERIC|nr:hypothetical protein RHGRI_009379 [Rhododendron griersonianum]
MIATLIPLSATCLGSSPSPRRKAAIRAAATAAAVATKKAGSLYEVLRVRRNASPTEIKAAYWSLAKLHHPDASRSDGRGFIEIHDAYATLSDPSARKLYDLSSSDGPMSRQFGCSRSGFYSTRKWETDQCW